MFRKGEKPKASPAGVTLLCSVANPFRFILIGIIDKYLKPHCVQLNVKS